MSESTNRTLSSFEPISNSIVCCGSCCCCFSLLGVSKTIANICFDDTNIDDEISHRRTNVSYQDDSHCIKPIDFEKSETKEGELHFLAHK
jgi:hypothetical protein